MTDKALLCVSFGTSYPDTLEKTIGAIEGDLARAFPDRSLRRAFTSGRIIRKIEARDGIHIDTVSEAMEKLAAEGFRDILVQPTHFMGGIEYEKVVRSVMDAAGSFRKITLGKPLLGNGEDLEEFCGVLSSLAAPAREAGAAMVFMGHGTEHDANAVYARLQEAAAPEVFIGTVEAVPSLEDVLQRVRKMPQVKQVILRPMMIVAGDHAVNDMAGSDEDSWASVFRAAGYEVLCILSGLGEVPEVRDMYIRHAENAEEIR